MKTKVVITVDTEPSIAGAFAHPERYKPLIHEPVWGEVDGESQALGFMLKTLRRHSLCATFFVETAHLSYFPSQVMGKYVQEIRSSDQDVQLHLHPCWESFAQGWQPGDATFSDQCGDLTEEQLILLMETGGNRISDWTGEAPCSMRTGNFSGSAAVYKAMKATGLEIASNICLSISPPPEARSGQWGDFASLAGGIHCLEGVTELPVACFKDNGPVGRGRLRGFQVTACSFKEQRAHLLKLHEANASVVVIVTHPFEFLQWTGPDFSRLRANQLVQGRFERLCAFLAENEDRFEVVPISHFANEKNKAEPAIDLEGNAVLATWRAAENFVNDRLGDLKMKSMPK